MQYQSDLYKIKFDKKLQIGFTTPLPKNVDKYYFHQYWTSRGIMGQIKKHVFDIFQKRRVTWVISRLEKGLVLDVGSGEGTFAKKLPNKFEVTSIESTTSKVKNKSVLKTDFLTWKTKKRFDCVCFWESLEHVRYPEKYIRQAYKLLKKGGYIFIEFPRFNCLESKLFGRFWFHQDLPRHLNHFTDLGIKKLLSTNEYKNVKMKNVLSFDYSPWGLTASVLKVFNLNITDSLKVNKHIILFILLIPLIIFSNIIEVIFFFINESPIGLIVAKK